MDAPVSVEDWYNAHRADFAPPVCNKLMHKEQLTVMFVGGPNSRTDFHLEAGPELFYMVRGSMELPIIERGKRRLVEIKENQLFLLPGRIPHSPQRPEAESLGLVVERARVEGEEWDALRYYVDFDSCDQVLWERNFHCADLGKDLVPVITAWKASSQCKTGQPASDSLPEKRRILDDSEPEIPAPIDLPAWLDTHAAELAKPGSSVDVFPGHPDRQSSVKVHGAPPSEECWEMAPAPIAETLLYQLRDAALVHMRHPELVALENDAEAAAVDAVSLTDPSDGSAKRRKLSMAAMEHTLAAGSCFVVPAGFEFRLVGLSSASATLVVSQIPEYKPTPPAQH